MTSLVLASRLVFGSNLHGLQDNQDADLANQLFNFAETSELNWNDNSTSNLPLPNNNQQLDQQATFLPPEDVENFFNKTFESTSNNSNYPTEYQQPAQETLENTDFDFGFQLPPYTNNDNDISTLQNNNLQFDTSYEFDLNLLGSPVTSLDQNDSTFTSYTEFEGSRPKSPSSISETVQIDGLVPQAPVQATFDLASNSLDFVTYISVVKSNSSRCKKYREDKKNQKIAAEEELKELELKNYTLKAKLKEKEEKVKKIKEMVKRFFDPRSPKKLSIDAILFEFV